MKIWLTRTKADIPQEALPIIVFLSRDLLHGTLSLHNENMEEINTSHAHTCWNHKWFSDQQNPITQLYAQHQNTTKKLIYWTKCGNFRHGTHTHQYFLRINNERDVNCSAQWLTLIASMHQVHRFVARSTKSPHHPKASRHTLIPSTRAGLKT